MNYPICEATISRPVASVPVSFFSYRWFGFTGRLILLLATLFGSSAFAQVIAVGNQVLQAQNDSNTAGQAEAFKTSAIATGTIVSITVYVDTGSAASKLDVGLYVDNAGKPGALLTHAVLSAPVSTAWNTITVPSVQVTSGATYWIAVLAPSGSGTLRFRDKSGGTRAETSASKTLTSLPASWTTGTAYSDSPLSAYASASGSIQPILSVIPTSLSFAYTQGGPAPTAATLTVANSGSGTLNFSSASNASWLSVSPSSGTAPQSEQVTLAVSSLVPNTYTGQITVTASGAQGSPVVIPVTLVVSAPVSQQVLSVSPASLAFTYTLGMAPRAAQSLTIANIGGGSLTFTGSSNTTWLAVTPVTGTAPQVAQVVVNTAALVAGMYTGQITVTASGAQGTPKIVPVTRLVRPRPPPPPPPNPCSGGGTPPPILFGDQTIGAQLDSNTLSNAEAFQTTAVSCGNIGSIALYLDASSTVTKVAVGLYADSGGHPGALLGQGTSSQLASGGWNTIPVTPVTLTQGTKYWVALLGLQSGSIRFRDKKGGCTSESSASSTLTSLPSVWSTGQIYSDCPLSAYGKSLP